MVALELATWIIPAHCRQFVAVFPLKAIAKAVIPAHAA